MSDTQPARARDASGWGWWIAAALLVALRLPHLTGPLDDPHSWRQADTARYSLEFARHGIDLAHPAVCWLGAHRTLIFEFPLPEAISALAQRGFGTGEHWDRIVGLAFFLVATFYLHAIVRVVANGRTAWLATLAWLAFPLGQFYSRAAVVDLAATAGAHALLFHAARVAQGGSRWHVAGGALGGALAAMIKAPYLLPILGPLALVALGVSGMSAWVGFALAMLVTFTAFRLWRGWVDVVNARAPDWNFLPGYYKEVNPLWWYFGEVKQRFEVAAWLKVARRLLTEVATPPGVVMAFAAPLAAIRGAAQRFGARAFGVAWAAGTLLYLLVFFPLNVIHNYYQIPFLAPAALLVALGFEVMWERARLVAAVVMLLFLFMAATGPSRLGYYRVDWLRVEAGRMIDRAVPKDALVVACDHASGYSDPRLLHRADRFGWSLAIPDLTPERVEKLRSLGATSIAIVTSPEHPELRAPDFLAPMRSSEQPILHDGRRLGTLALYALAPPPAEVRP